MSLIVRQWDSNSHSVAFVRFREEWAILGFIDFSVIGIKTMCSTDLLSMYIASPDVVIGSCLGYL